MALHRNQLGPRDNCPSHALLPRRLSGLQSQVPLPLVLVFALMLETDYEQQTALGNS